MKITSIDGAKGKDTTADALNEMRRQLPNIFEAIKLNAEIHRQKYLALKAQGFSDEQALELSKIIP